MTLRSTLVACGTCAAVATPTTAVAAGPLAAPAPLGKHTTVAAKIRSDARAAVERRTLRLARKEGRLRGATLTAAFRHRLDGMSVRELVAERGRLRDEIAKDRKARAGTGGAPNVPIPGRLRAIAACESGGNPTADTGNGFYGKYQFTQSTWASVGGTGNPAAAPEAEQDRRAAMLLARSGSSPWPVCGG
ncbi:MAG: transglycosylase family protein [Solirubrobacteraceae bacterium]